MRKTTTILTGLVLAFAIASCNGKKENKETEVHHATDRQMHAVHKLDVKTDNKIDPVCGMEIEGHLADTIHYAGKVYGFCSSGCKEEFAKNPGNYFSKMN